MADFEITTRIDDAEVQTALEHLARTGKNMRPVMSAIGDIILTSVDKNFEAQGRYERAGSWRGGSNKWAPLSTATKWNIIGGSSGYTKGGLAFGRIRKSASNRLTKKKILQDSGQLVASLSKSVQSDSVTIGTNKAYAAVHQFGINKSVRVSRHGKTVFGTKSSSVSTFMRHMRIPARPFLVVQPEDIVEIKRTIIQALVGTWKQ